MPAGGADKEALKHNKPAPAGLPESQPPALSLLPDGGRLWHLKQVHRTGVLGSEDEQGD